MNLSETISAFRPLCEQEETDRRVMLQVLERDPTCFSRENLLYHFTASSWIFDPGSGQVLMLWHNIYHSWSWSGGHADGETDLLRVALREAKEETGLHGVVPASEAICSLETLPVPAHVRRGVFVPAHLHLNVTYMLRADAAEPLRVKPDENSALCWMAPSDAVARSGEELMKPIYRKLNERLEAFF